MEPSSPGRDNPRIVLLGATGFTGSLIAKRLVGGDTSTPVMLAARDPLRLDRLVGRLRGLARRPPATAILDVTDTASLDALIRPRDVVINTAGPFARLGEPVMRACIENGAHYVDTTGEQPWMRQMHDQFHDAARAAGIAMVNGLAFEWTLGDCAVALAAHRLPGALRTVDVVYAWRGPAASRGTRRTSLRIVATRGWQLENGRWTRRATGAASRPVAMASGQTLGAITFAAGEVVTVPRWSRAETVRGWLAVGRRTARIAPLVAPALPVLARGLGPLLEKVVTRAPDPTDQARECSEFTIRVETADDRGHRLALEVHGRDPYGLTAEVAVRGAYRALRPDPPAGVLAPSRLFEPQDLLDTLPLTVTEERVH